MNENIPNFDDALESFRRLLIESGHPTNIFWVFREEIWKRSPTDVVLRLPSQTQNLILARKVFDEGRKEELVDVHAMAAVGNKVAATIWFPKFARSKVGTAA